MSDLICGRIAAGEKYNLTCDKMDKERYAKDTENKTFYEKQQEAHRSHNLKILGSAAIVSGLVYKYRKPLMDMGRKLITKA